MRKYDIEKWYLVELEAGILGIDKVYVNRWKNFFKTLLPLLAHTVVNRIL